MEESGAVHITSSTHYPSSNGMSERGVHAVKNTWRRGGDQNNVLPVYQRTLLESGSWPDEPVIGRRLRSSLLLQHTIAAETG